MLHDVFDRPWQNMAVDLFPNNGKECLLIVDYYSDYIGIDVLTTTTTAALTNKPKYQCRRSWSLTMVPSLLALRFRRSKPSGNFRTVKPACILASQMER